MIKTRIINCCKKCFKFDKSLEIIDKYKCIEYEKIFFSSCYLSDIHIKKNLINFYIETNRCPKDQSVLTYYCLNYKENVFFCLKKYDDEKKSS